MNIKQQESKKKQFLESLPKTFTISAASHAIGIDRKTFYRWAEVDPDFKQQVYETLQEGRKFVTDMATVQVITHIKNGNLTASMYWLNNKDPNISDKAMQMTDEEIVQLSDYLSNAKTFQKGQELLIAYGLRGKISERFASLIIKLFLVQMKAEDIIIRRNEIDILNKAMFRKNKQKQQD